MLTIALDEQGDFEGLYDEKKTGAPIFIGGLVFDDQGKEQEHVLEKQRIHHYLKAVCESEEASYPQDLHVNDSHNHAKVKRVKTRLGETLAEFMAEGTCRSLEGPLAQRLNRMPKRTGVYYIFSNLLCDDGSQKIRAAESMLAREDYGSNLYIHMAEDVIERLIFHNPVIASIDHVHLELATRRVVLEGEDCNERAEQYQRMGYQEDRDPEHLVPGRRIFCLTNKDVYRTAIQREMMDTEQKYIQFDAIGVRSIYYGRETDSFRMEYLYLADVVCSCLGYQLSAKTPQDLVWEFKRRADRYTGHENNLIFVHDPVDTGFRKAWTRLEAKDYYHALRLAYDSIHMENPYASYYREVWFSLLRKRLLREASLIDYRISVERLYDYTRQNNMNQNKLMYIFSVLEAMKDHMTYQDDSDKAVLYKLYDCGVSAYCHLGRPSTAKSYFEKCRAYAKYIDFETYIRTRSKLSVCLCDEFAYQEAEALAEENRDLYEELIPLRRLISGDDMEKTLNYGITCSQLGQAQAFQRQKEAEESFLKALAQMEEDSPNYWITVSYLLHFYLDMGMREKYEALSVPYFGGKKGLREQFSYILSEGSKGRQGKISLKFALYVFVRGVFLFYRERISGPMLDKLMNIEEVIRKEGLEAVRQTKGHPWEIIYKYLALLAWETGNREKAEEYTQNIETAAPGQGMVIDMICWFGQLEAALFQGRREEAERLFRQTPESLPEDSPVRSLIQPEEPFEKAYAVLEQKIFTFMYR